MNEQQLQVIKDYFDEYNLEDTYRFLEDGFETVLEIECIDPTIGFRQLRLLKAMLAKLDPTGHGILTNVQSN